MKSTKILTLNPIPSGVNQKLVPAKKYNELWDDVHAIEARSYQPSIIGDKGLGDDVIAISGIGSSLSLVGTSLSAYGAISLSDILTFIHYTGTQSLIYYIRRQGDPVWISNVNIGDAVIPLTQNNAGNNVIEAKVGNGSVESNPIEVTVNVWVPPV